MLISLQKCRDEVLHNRNILKIIQITLAAAAFMLCVFLWGQIIGLEQGYKAAKSLYPLASNGISLSSGGPTVFEEFIGYYTITTISSFVCLISSLFKQSMLIAGICILSSGVSIFQFWQIISTKNYLLADHFKYSYINWVGNSVYFDWVCLAIAVILIISHIISYFVGIRICRLFRLL